MASQPHYRGNVYQVGADYRADLLRREQATVDDVTRRWLAARNAIQTELDAVLRKIEAARALGKLPVVRPVASGLPLGPDQYTAAWLYQAARFDKLRQAIEDELATFNAVGLANITKRMGIEAATGGRDANSLLGFRMRDDGLIVPRQFAELPQDAVAQIMSYAAPGGPIPKAFRGMADELVSQMQDRLAQGVVQGQNGRVVGRKMQADAIEGGILDRPLYEQVRVASTEPLRAYREATRATYQANSDVVEGWEWGAFPGPRTCGYCLAMDGQRFSNDEVMATHPFCRCAELPFTELSAPPTFAGARFLYDADADEQDEILGGHTMAELYRQGKIDLGDVVRQYEHPDWGAVGHMDSMKGMVGRGIITNDDVNQASDSHTAAPTWKFQAPEPSQLLVPVLPKHAQAG